MTRCMGSCSLPATVEDADLLGRQGAYSSLIGTAFITLLSIVSAGPERLVDRLGGPLDKGLSQQCRALPSPVESILFTAPLGHRRNTRVLLYCSCASETLALFTEGYQQSGR